MPIFDQASLDRQVRQAASYQTVPNTGDMPMGGPPSPLENLDNGSTWGPAAMTVAGNAADTLSTLWALKHAGIEEKNPVFGHSPAAIVGLKAAMTVPQIYAEHKLVEAGHPTMAKIMGASIAGLGAALAAHNIAAVKGLK